MSARDYIGHIGRIPSSGLVDTYRGLVRETNFVRYALFVTYFPHLIAGPVLHHKEVMPQFADPRNSVLRSSNIAIGSSIFIIGLFKKMVVADSIAGYVVPAFTSFQPSLLVAWGATLGFTLQIYFDFSGYSDMAIGLSRLFGVRLPANFNSPYKAQNISEFWRRWHMSLSRFLHDYLYIPLGGNRKGPSRRYANLMATMVLGGIWHGAAWNFVAWGPLHGGYLAIHHAWLGLLHRIVGSAPSGIAERIAAHSLTLLAVIVGWVFFRATSLANAVDILRGMIGLNGVELPLRWKGPLGILADGLMALGAKFTPANGFPEGQLAWITLPFAICLLLPNSQQITRYYRPLFETDGQQCIHFDSHIKLTW
ncbi:MAG: MBOAT family protein [Magnetococcales bacterium]|nr:MBOAT family protein [Magnetococcales bacterium]